MIHPLSDVEYLPDVGPRSRIWRWTHIQKGAKIGTACMIGQGCHVASGAVIGDRVRIQNGVSVWSGVTIEDDCFIGPNVTFTNVKRPTPARPVDGYERTVIRSGATIGANSTIVCGIEIGSGAFVGAGSVVTRSVPSGATVYGNPARVHP